MAFTPHEIIARNGQTLRVRYLTPEDGDLLIDLVLRLSEESRYQRFHVSIDDMPMAELIRRLPPYLDVDGVNSVALLALTDEEDGEHVVGVARFRRQPDQLEAEAAVVVRDDWHRQGIGTALMRQLAEAALSVGVKRFIAMTQAGNRAVHTMIRNMGIEYDSHFDSGEDYIVMHLEEKTP